MTLEMRIRGIPSHKVEQRRIVAFDVLVELESFQARLSPPSGVASQHLGPSLHDAACSRVIACPARLALWDKPFLDHWYDHDAELASRRGEPELRDDLFRRELLGAEREEQEPLGFERRTHMNSSC